MPEMGLEETRQAIEAASKAFKTWSKTTAKVRPGPELASDRTLGARSYCAYDSLQQRHDILMKFYGLMQEHQDDLARLIVRPSPASVPLRDVTVTGRSIYIDP